MSFYTESRTRFCPFHVSLLTVVLLKLECGRYHLFRLCKAVWMCICLWPSMEPYLGCWLYLAILHVCYILWLIWELAWCCGFPCFLLCPVCYFNALNVLWPPVYTSAHGFFLVFELHCFAPTIYFSPHINAMICIINMRIVKLALAIIVKSLYAFTCCWSIKFHDRNIHVGHSFKMASFIALSGCIGTYIDCFFHLTITAF